MQDLLDLERKADELRRQAYQKEAAVTRMWAKFNGLTEKADRDGNSERLLSL
jgi:hypothetical protein